MDHNLKKYVICDINNIKFVGESRKNIAGRENTS